MLNYCTDSNQIMFRDKDRLIVVGCRSGAKFVIHNCLIILCAESALFSALLFDAVHYFMRLFIML